MNLFGKIAIVTGVSKGIGNATVHALLDKGCIVAGWGRTDPEIEQSNFHFFKVDIRSYEDVERVHAATVSAVGDNIAILVNNAGLGYEGQLDALEVDKWHEMFDTNVNGLFYCTRLVLPKMKKLEESHIINISSIAGTTGIPGMSGYCATKHAVRGLSQSLYKEVRDEGVKVTCVYPGSVKTNFFDDIDSVEPNDHMMRPEDIASTIIHCLESHPNFHHVDIEVRPLKPKG